MRCWLATLAMTFMAGTAAIAAPGQKVTVHISQTADQQCRASVDGKALDSNDDAAIKAILAPHDLRKVEAHLVGDINTPYRCIGGLIYALQRAGVAKIGFISEPEPVENKERPR